MLSLLVFIYPCHMTFCTVLAVQYMRCRNNRTGTVNTPEVQMKRELACSLATNLQHTSFLCHATVLK